MPSCWIKPPRWASSKAPSTTPFASGTREDRIVCEEIARTEVVAVSLPNSPCREGTPVIIPSPCTGTRRAIEAYLNQTERSWTDYNIILELESTSAIVTAVCRGLGIGLVPHLAVARELDVGQLIIAHYPDLRCPLLVHMLYHHDFLEGDAANQLLDQLRTST